MIQLLSVSRASCFFLHICTGISLQNRTGKFVMLSAAFETSLGCRCNCSHQILSTYWFSNGVDGKLILLIKKICEHTLWSLGHSIIVGWLIWPLLYLKISICSAIRLCVSFNYTFLIECLYWCSTKLARKRAVKCSQVSLRRPEWRQCRICKKGWCMFQDLLSL